MQSDTRALSPNAAWLPGGQGEAGVSGSGPERWLQFWDMGHT